MKEEILLTLKEEDFSNSEIDFNSINPQLLARIIEELKERVNDGFQTELSIVYSMITKEYTQIIYTIWHQKSGFRITQNTTNLNKKEANKVIQAYEKDIWGVETEIKIDQENEALTLYYQVDNSHPDLTVVTLEMPEYQWIALAKQIIN